MGGIQSPKIIIISQRKNRDFLKYLTPPVALAIRRISPIAAALGAQVFTWNGPGTGVNYGGGRASIDLSV